MNSQSKNKTNTVKFGDVAKRVNDLFPDRSKWNFTKYVTGRDFESGEVRIKHYNQIKGNENLIGYQFQWRFQPNDVLYVVKNPRLRKAALVDFEGICSISTFVIRTDETKFLQKLLPFLMQTEEFTSFARKNQHGSTNPFLNWKDIAKFEFNLPSLEHQKQILNILLSIEKHIENLENLLEKTKNYMISRRESLLTRGIGHTKFKKVPWLFGKEIEIPEEWEVKKIEDVFEFLVSGTNARSDLNDSDEIRYIHYGDIHTKWNLQLDCDLEKIPRITEEKVSNIPLLKDGDLIIADVSEDVEGSGTSVLLKNVKNKKIVAGLHTLVLRSKDENISFEFMKYLTSISHVKIQIISYVTGSKVFGLSKKSCKEIKVPFPTLAEQQKIASILSNIDKQITQQQSHLNNLKVLRKSILNSKLTKEKTDVTN